MNILNAIGAGIVAVGLFIGSLFGYTPDVQAPIETPSEELGVALPSGTANFESSLATGISNTATTMTLTSITIRGGGSLSGYQCFTIDEGSAQAEFVCGTASSTSVGLFTGLERGISPADGITEDTDLQFSHRRGASVKITDFPLLQRLKSQSAGSGTYTAPLVYEAGVTPSGGSELADVEYVLSAISGTSTLSYNKTVVNGTAGETVVSGSIVYLKASDSRWYKADNDLPSTYVDQTLGIAQGAGTSGNSISGGVLTYGVDATQSGMTGGNFVFLSATAGATSSATTSQVLGKAISATTMFFDQNLIDSSVYVPTTFSAAATFSGITSFTATTTGTLGSSTMRIYTATSTWSKPAYLKYITLWVCGAGGNGGIGSASSDSGAGGGGGGCGYSTLDYGELLGTSSIQVAIASNGGTSRFSTFCSATSGTNASTITRGAGGTATGCDYNYSGAGGTGGSSGASGDFPGGAGGASMLGLGGGGGTTPSGNGDNGTEYGGGAGGGAGSNGSGAGNGGTGATGVVIITEYF